MKIIETMYPKGKKCPECNWESSYLYALSEYPKCKVCSSCFTESLIKWKADIKIKGVQ